ncbi:MAG TPA: HAMP domain-containing sensor histidine kinase [Xanthomonadaceae bacterium]|nr:HAMP domain-containing sensor histidine kinase [Xanthomonadaceae bacterium]
MVAALPRKIRIAVILQVALAGALVALGAFVVSSYVRDRVVEQALELEAGHYWEQRKLDPAYPAPQSRTMRAYAVDRGGSASQVPAALRGLEPGVHQLSDPNLVVLVDEQPEGRLYVTYPSDRARELTLALIAAPVILAVLALALSGWLTYRVARRLVAPMGWLAGEVRNWDPRNPDVRGLAADRLPPDADEETRELAGALHAMAERVRAFVARERDFTRDASHELRTPLTVIRVASDLLLGDPDMPARSQRSLSRIQRAGRDMEAVIDAFLILAREADVAPQSEDFEVIDVVHEEIERTRESGNCPKEGVSLEVVEEASIRLHAPPRVLGLMLGNLLDNACRFTNRGRIEVRIGNNRVEVRDTGIGMGPETIDRAFEPFYRADIDSAQGKGMGLSIVRRLGERFGWPVTLESTPGKGTVATIRFG